MDASSRQNGKGCHFACDLRMEMKKWLKKKMS